MQIMIPAPCNHEDIVTEMRISLAADKHTPEIVLVQPDEFNQHKPELRDIPVHKIVAIDDLSLLFNDIKYDITQKFICHNQTPKKLQSFRCKNNIDRLRAINSTKKLS